MVKKTKKRRSFNADKHNSKTRIETEKKTNPFDLHVNRLKHDVLGKRRNYEKGGQPLKSRSRGIEKRKRTLLKELNSVFKKSTFIDHRLGENDPTLTNDEKIMQRLIAERTKIRPGKESRYNLNDEEDLTHYGQSLSKSDEMNQKPVIDDYDDDDLNKGRLNSEHFFGGFKSMTDQHKPQTKQEWIENMIKTTKLDKYERQRENEKVFDMTQTLDEQWKALSALVGIKEKKSKENKDTHDDYDKLVNSLRFEAKTTGVPVKTIEEKQKEEADRLKTLQEEEKNRMSQPSTKNRTQIHYFVEELDDSYYIMDGSNKRVTFDDNDDTTNYKELPPIETEEINDNDIDDQNDGEVEETMNEDFITEFDEIPSDLEKLQTRLKDEKTTLTIIWKRINNNRLPAIPKSVLINYFDVLLDYYESIDSNEIVFNQLGKNLLQLLQLINNEQTKINIINRLKQYHQYLSELIENEKFCQVDRTFIFFLKLIAHLYPTSDFRHPITTPALTLIIQAIYHTSLNSLSSCRQGLLLIELVKQWIFKNHHYVPEVMMLFIKILQLACPMEKSEYFISYPSKQLKNNRLFLSTESVNLSSLPKLSFFNFDDLNDDNNEHRTRILLLYLYQLSDFLNIYQSLSAIIEITQPFKSLLMKIVDCSLCPQISSQCQEILKFIDTIQNTCQINRKYLQQAQEQKKMLRLFEPRFGPVYEGQKNSRLPKEHADRLRLQQKYKRQLKGTIRELRLDSQFIAREELRQQMEKDAQRQRKVKDIHAQLSMQEGEYRKMQKTK